LLQQLLFLALLINSVRNKLDIANDHSIPFSENNGIVNGIQQP
jgi:hypothetical protein